MVGSRHVAAVVGPSPTTVAMQAVANYSENKSL